MTTLQADGTRTRKNLSGHAFGSLMVLDYFGRDKREEAVWRCECACGKIVNVRNSILNSKKEYISCGCGGTGKLMPDGRVLRSEDLTGRKFGDLIVMHYYGVSSRSSTWMCQCSCGKSKEILGKDLKSGRVISCGCKSMVGNKSDRLPNNKSSINNVIKIYKRNAEKRNKYFNLSYEFVERLIQSPCYYCGCEPQSKIRNLKYNGIDRVNNECGYEEHNVVPCCSACNYAKRQMTVEQFESWVYNLFDHINARKIRYGAL